MEPCCPGDGEHLSAHGKQGMNSLACSVCTQLVLYLLNCTYFNTRVPFLSPFSSSPTCCCEGHRMRGCVELRCQPGMNSDTKEVVMASACQCSKTAWTILLDSWLNFQAAYWEPGLNCCNDPTAASNKEWSVLYFKSHLYFKRKACSKRILCMLCIMLGNFHRIDKNSYYWKMLKAYEPACN